MRAPGRWHSRRPTRSPSPTATADATGWTLGDPLTVTFADGAAAEVTVGATYAVPDIVGGYVLPRDALCAAPHQPVDSRVVGSWST